MCQMGSKKETETLPTARPMSPYSTPEGEALAKANLSGTSAALPQAVSDAKAGATAYRTAASDPIFGQIGNYGNALLRGDYLNGSPALTTQLNTLDQAGARRAADMGSRVRSQFSMTGAPLSTGMLQALQAGQASQAANTEATKANTIFQNYQAERGYQNAAPSLIYSNLQAPGAFLGQASQMPLNPYQQATQILQSDRQPMLMPIENIQTNKPGILNYIGAGFKAAGAAMGPTPYGGAAAGVGGVLSAT